MRQAKCGARGAAGVLSCVLVMVATACVAEEVSGGENATVRPFERSVPADGWRWESSLGVEVAVPDHWTINDTDCNQSDAPTVVRSQGVVFDCFTPEPLIKEIVQIAPAPDAPDVERPDGLDYRDVMVGAAAAERGEGETADGRAAGWLHIPSIGVIVDVRVKDRETLLMVLDSVRVVAIDNNGCATARKDMGPVAPKGDALVPSRANAVSVCYFGQSDVLQASAWITGAAAQDLVDALNGSPAGRNVDVPESMCLHESELPPPEAMVIVHGDDDNAQLEVTFSGCTHRGISNGRSEAKLSLPLLDAMMKPLASGYSYSPYGLDPVR
jgi:hypothetical protein